MSQIEKQEGWPLARMTKPKCETFYLPDRLGDGSPFTAENYSRFRSLEELGIQDWQFQTLSVIIPLNQPLLIWASASTWKLTELSKWNRTGRLAWADGLQWEHHFGYKVSATIPSGPSSWRLTVFRTLGFDDEWSPEFILCPHGQLESWDKEKLISWCRKRELWSNPCWLIPETVESIIAIFNGWVYIAATKSCASSVIRRIESLAQNWGIPLIEGPQDGAWIF